MDMKIGKWKRSVGWMVLAAVLAAGGVTACKASGSASGEGEVGPYRFRFKVNSNGGTYDAEGPDDRCLEVEWRDSKGNSLGKTTISLPSSGQVPPGSASWDAQEVDCPEPEQGNGDPGVDRVRSFEVFGSPVIPDVVDGGPSKNATYRFLVNAKADVDAFALVEPILRAGPGAVVPSGVEVLSFTQMIPENGGARLVAADSEPFQSFQMDWNGQVAYATLGSNSVTSSVGSWTTVEVRIPATAFNGISVANHGEIQRSTASNPVPLVERASWTWLP
ncbi:MAG TPA: hypothetical protein VMS76_20355 [Planctomycetota bacterium]|nr:hypothetical protein [Planctomycetota bacterium]